MHWKKKYKKAIERGTQLIVDKVIRDSLIREYGEMFATYQEVRFPRFTADFLLLNPVEKLLIGIEVKSDRDTLDRLQGQLREYCRYCHYVYVATTLLHRRDVLEVLDSYEDFKDVGLLIYIMGEEGNKCEVVRTAGMGAVEKVGCKWIGPRHQLNQWLYLLERIWG